MRLEAVCYEHAAALIGASPWLVSRDAGLLASAHAAAARRYGSSTAVVGIDVYNLEAEAMGAQVAEAGPTSTPTIDRHPHENLDELCRVPPIDPDRGRLRMTVQAADQLRSTVPGLAVRLPVAGPFATAAGLMGMQSLIMEAATDPAAVADTLMSLVAKVKPWFDLVGARGYGAAVFESGAAPPMLSPDLFAQVVAPALRTWLTALREATGSPAALILGGDTARIAQQIADLPAAAMIVPAETDQPTLLARLASRDGLALRVNLNAAVFSSGDAARVEHEVLRVASWVAAVRRPQLTLGTGVLGYDADPAWVDAARAVLRSRFPETHIPVV